MSTVDTHPDARTTTNEGDGSVAPQGEASPE
jgi:hypothetical protein